MITLIVSDTNCGDEASVASGPTLAPSPDVPRAAEVIEQYNLKHVLPVSIVKAVEFASADDTETPGTHHVLLGNWTALEAAARKASELGFACVVREDICEQRIEDGCKLLLSNIHGEGSICEISGGEFSCPVRGNGRGGRNVETVLRCAMLLSRQNNPHHTVVLSAGTDGIDGNTPCAGAIADETTVGLYGGLRLAPEDYLARSDSYGIFDFFDRDLILTGPTGTNVRDVRIVLKSAA
jgi:glycerate-2-kinase